MKYSKTNFIFKFIRITTHSNYEQIVMGRKQQIVNHLAKPKLFLI